MRRSIAALVVCGSVATLWGATIAGWAQPTSPGTPDLQTVLQTYCIGCHNQRLRTAGVAFDSVDLAQPAGNPELWERVIAKLRAGSMPPPGRPRPAPAIYPALASALEADIDRAWASRPRAGRLSAVHRLNRTEYNNAIRDLFALDAAAVDVRPLLPGDETADGSFDNFADSLSISPVHLERYLSVARQITRLVTGVRPATSSVARFEIPLHVVQDERQDEDLPRDREVSLEMHRRD